MDIFNPLFVSIDPISHILAPVQSVWPATFPSSKTTCTIYSTSHELLRLGRASFFVEDHQRPGRRAGVGNLPMVCFHVFRRRRTGAGGHHPIPAGQSERSRLVSRHSPTAAGNTTAVRRHTDLHDPGHSPRGSSFLPLSGKTPTFPLSGHHTLTRPTGICASVASIAT